METELKLSFKNTESLMDVASSDLFSEISVISGPKTMMLENYYLDTADMKILHRHGSVRKRIVKGEESYIEGTVKYGGGSANGLHKRLEWNVDSNDANFSIERFIREAEGGKDPSDKLLEAFGSIKDEELIVLCSNSFNRTIYNLDYKNSRIEACFDSGIIKSSDGSRTDEICELELELIDGDVDSLNELTRMIMEHMGCVPLDDTKYRRTLAMTLNGETRK